LSFGSFIQQLRREGLLVEAQRPVAKRLEASGLIAALQGRPVFFHVKESPIPMAANICASRQLVAHYFDTEDAELIPRLLQAMENPSKAREIQSASCFEVREDHVNLDILPILYHYEGDGGCYITSAVTIARHRDVGQNMSFHRLMQISRDTFAIRILPRHLNALIEKSGGEIDAAFCIGTSPNVLLAAATSVELGVDELWVANTLKSLDVAYCTEADCFVPADSEFVLVGTITRELHDEGPFVDITGTYDVVRKQPVVKIKTIYHRRTPIYQALLPGGLEHKLLMGTPREPAVWRAVSKVCHCIDVRLTPGGCSWLHGIVKIRKDGEDDGLKAVEAAFRGHPSMKHVVVVDEDIDISKPEEVEWALATRFQANRGLVVKNGEKGSSLDPSADPMTRITTKVGFDATLPKTSTAERFRRASPQKLDFHQYV